jgi:hypothetical protein
VREHYGEPGSAASEQQRSDAPAKATAVDVVSGWQRSLGNTAVSLILSRQEALETPTRIDRDDPLIQTVHGPLLGERGTYRWYVRYQLPFAATSDGWLIQELSQDSSHGAGDHFWECWRVRSGQRYPEDPADVDGIAYDDRYVMGSGGSPADSGWHRHVGVIRFYAGPLPSEFGADRGVNFYVTRTQPSGWTGQGMRHDAYSEWEYRAGRARLNGFVAYAGTREYRLGDTVSFRPRTTGAATVPRRL